MSSPILAAAWPARGQILSVIGEWLDRQRWFPSAQPAQSQHVIGYSDNDSDGLFRDLIIETDEGAWVHVPLAIADTWDGEGVIAELTHAVLIDALHHPGFIRHWLDQTYQAHGLGMGVVDPHTLYTSMQAAIDQARPLGHEQSNSSLIIPATPPVIVKFFRILVAGEHPEVNVPHTLLRGGFSHVPTTVGYSTMMVTGNEHEAEKAYTASLQYVIEDAHDGFLRMSQAAHDQRNVEAEAEELGAITRHMHDTMREAFGEGETMSGASVAARIMDEAKAAMAVCAPLREDTETLHRLDQLGALLQTLGQLPPSQRVHGDYHLGQCLYAHNTWYVLDFEGEPLRPLSERLAPDQPVRDVAGMTRSFDYARVMGHGTYEWAHAARNAYIRGYFHHDASDLERLLLTSFEIAKALYEVRYESLQRPDWVSIPLEAVRRHVKDVSA